MLTDWLYRTTLEVSFLIGLILIIRPIVRRLLGAGAANGLWFLPLICVFVPFRPSRPPTVLEAMSLTGGRLDVMALPKPDAFDVANGTPVAAIWVAGLVLWVGARGVRWIRSRRTLETHSARRGPPTKAIARLPARLRRLDVRYFSSALPGTPFVSGLLRPSVYLPEDFERRFNTSERKCIVHHELMHFLRRDTLVRGVWEVLRAAFWFNPLVHTAAIAVRTDQEFACDQSVLASCSAEERFHYARALLIGAGAFALPQGISFFSRPRERVIMIEKHRKSSIRNIAGVALFSLIGILTLTTAPLSMAQQSLDKPVTLNFRVIDIERVIEMLADVSGATIEGINRVEGATITLRASDRPVGDVLMQLLNCVGHTFRAVGDSFEIVPLASEADATFECGDFEVRQTV